MAVLKEDALNGFFKINIKKAILYLRVSTRRQARRGGGDDEGFSIPAQREAGHKKAAELGAVVVKEFVDRGASAKSVDREHLQDMLEYIEEHPDIDYVIIHKVDRLARDRGDDADISRALAKHGVKLVSTMEPIDETPAGMLLHGMLATFAEFYSRNLATEVMKGMVGKFEKGGTVGRAPLGYLNLQRVDSSGAEERYVEPDPERAPLIKQAFEMFATGDWVVADLAEHLAMRGLATRTTPEIPSKPMDKRALNQILLNPYYKGMMKFNGKYRKGKHQPLIDDEIWQKVQDVLASHVNGERTRQHPHFLKSTVYCGACGERLLIQYAKAKSGVRYPYFSCAGRHSKRNDCKQRSVLIEEIERQVEVLYERISFTPEYREQLEKQLLTEIRLATEGFETERRELETEKDKLQRKQKKLLEAHYDDAIPPELFKEEQRKLADAIIAIDSRIKLQAEDCAEAEDKLNKALLLLEDCGKLYKNAPEQIKRAFNLALFEKIYVHWNEDGGVTVSPVFTPAYAVLFNQPAAENTATTATEAPQGTENGSPLNSGAVSLARFFPPLKQNPAQLHFFGQGFIKNILVDVNGFEPLTLRTSSECSTN